MDQGAVHFNELPRCTDIKKMVPNSLANWRSMGLANLGSAQYYEL